ncbi:MAG: hypothetical protein FJZ07_01150 [Candidatus Nealsonbacteria bacterium]|nr:hypothetical protein [Candidatus Nealsonbacteria bacterium]
MAKKFFDIIPPEKVRKEVREKVKSPGIKRTFLKGSVFCLFFLVLFLLFSFFFFSKIKIEIWPETEIITLGEKLIIDEKSENISFSNKVIPGKIFDTERTLSEEFLSSGKTLKERRAEGVIRVYNDYHLNQTLVANTRFQPPLERFQSPLEKGENPWFRLAERVNIPAKSSIEVRVVADSPGEKYNISPSTFSVPGLAGSPTYTFVYGKSSSPMVGGFKDEVPQVLKEDLDKAESVLAEKLKTESKKLLKTIIPSGFLLLDGAVSQKVTETTVSVQVGEEAEFFNFGVRVQSDGLAFKESDLENFSKNIIGLEIPEGKKIDEESLEINFLLDSIDIDEGKMVLKLEIRAKIYSAVDLAGLKSAIFGKSLKEVQLFLENLEQLVRVDVKSWPFWRRRVPENIEKIELRLNLDPVDYTGLTD